MTVQPVNERGGVYESIYPERKTVHCERCRCQHWEGGRCFAQDEAGWPIVLRVLGEGKRHLRPIEAEGRRSA